MQNSLIIAGFGGQGVMLMGKLLGLSAFEAGKNVTFLPAYGPEQRGGTANTTVIISDEAIGSPAIYNPDVLCALNQPSLEKFINRVKPNGIVIINSSLIDKSKIKRTDIKIVEAPIDKIAMELGSSKTANIIMLGVYIELTNSIDTSVVKTVLTKQLAKKPELVILNEKAFEIGRQLVIN